MDDMTLTQALAAHGMYHRPTQHGMDRRSIIDAETHEVLFVGDARETWAWLRER